jgi:hypothetical protein
MLNRSYRNALSRLMLKELPRTLFSRHADSTLQDFPEKKKYTSSLLTDILEQTQAEMILQGRYPENILEESPEKTYALESGILLSRYSLQDTAE